MNLRSNCITNFINWKLFEKILVGFKCCTVISIHLFWNRICLTRYNSRTGEINQSNKNRGNNIITIIYVSTVLIHPFSGHVNFALERGVLVINPGLTYGPIDYGIFHGLTACFVPLTTLLHPFCKPTPSSMPFDGAALRARLWLMDDGSKSCTLSFISLISVNSFNYFLMPAVLGVWITRSSNYGCQQQAESLKFDSNESFNVLFQSSNFEI